MSGIFIELAISTIGQRAKRVLGHPARLGQCAKLDQRAKSRQCSEHKVIKETEKPFQPEFNQSKAETNDNSSKLSAGTVYLYFHIHVFSVLTSDITENF